MIGVLVRSLCSSWKLSAFPLRSLRLCGEDWAARTFLHRRDAENAEEAQFKNTLRNGAATELGCSQYPDESGY